MSPQVRLQGVGRTAPGICFLQKPLHLPFILQLRELERSAERKRVRRRAAGVFIGDRFVFGMCWVGGYGWNLVRCSCEMSVGFIWLC